MKKFIIILMTTLTLLATVFAVTPVSANQTQWGRIEYSFENLNDFELYHSYGKGFYSLNGYLWTDRYQEAKAICKDISLTDADISVQLFTPTEGAYLDGGIYFGVIGQTANGVDLIDAYEVHVKRDSGHNVSGATSIYTIEIYRFKHAWEGVVASTSVMGHTNVTLSLKIRGRILEVYTDGCEKPRLVYQMNDYIGGKIGLRTYQCQMGFKNLKIEGKGLPLLTQQLDALIKRTEAIDLSSLISESKENLTTALNQAKNAIISNDQRVIDQAYLVLEIANNRAITAFSREELNALIAQAKQINNGYYEHGKKALDGALERALKLPASADEKSISLAAFSLQNALDSLIKE